MNQDGTNTILDDNVKVIVNGQVANGLLKQRYLAWRGWQDPVQPTTWYDDLGNPTYAASAATQDDEGDLRPAPILLPILP